MACKANQTKFNNYGVLYNMDTANHSVLAPKTDNPTVPVHIIRIMDESGHEIVNARVAGTYDEADEAATRWLNAFCRVNPGKLARFTTELAKDQY